MVARAGGSALGAAWLLAGFARTLPERVEHAMQEQGLPCRVQSRVANAELVQLERGSEAEAPVRSRQVVEQQKFARTQHDVLFDGVEFEAALCEMGLLLTPRAEFQSAQEARCRG